MRNAVAFVLLSASSIFAMKEKKTRELNTFEMLAEKKLGANWEQQVTKDFNTDYDAFRKICVGVSGVLSNARMQRAALLAWLAPIKKVEDSFDRDNVQRTILLYSSIVKTKECLEKVLREVSHKGFPEVLVVQLPISINKLNGLAEKIGVLWGETIQVVNTIQGFLIELNK